MDDDFNMTTYTTVTFICNFLLMTKPTFLSRFKKAEFPIDSITSEKTFNLADSVFMYQLLTTQNLLLYQTVP